MVKEEGQEPTEEVVPMNGVPYGNDFMDTCPLSSDELDARMRMMQMALDDDYHDEWEGGGQAWAAWRWEVSLRESDCSWGAMLFFGFRLGV